jgi:5-methylcytosine-specific restriction endonuclease McrA
MALGRRTGTKKKRRGTASWKVAAWKADPHCHYCRQRLRSPEMASVDHEVPLASGGYSKRTNYLLACRPCNFRKGAKSYDSFIAEIGSQSH